MRILLSCTGLFALTFFALTLTAYADSGKMIVDPPVVSMSHRHERVQLVVSDSEKDKTHHVTYHSEDQGIVHVDQFGRVTAMSPGQTKITIRQGEQQIEIPVDVGAGERIDYLKDIRPILSKGGCSAGACHAAQFGQGGFKLSVFGYDPDADYEAMTRSNRGRRVNFASPDRSLLLRKAVLAEPHGGGLRFLPGSVEYAILRNWISAGAPSSTNPELVVQRLKVVPERRIAQLGESQQLRVIADFNDNSQRDVTALAAFDAIDQSVVSVNDRGSVQVKGRGQTAIMIRYEGQVAVSTFVAPYQDAIEITDWQSNNFVDDLVVQKFNDLGLEPSPLCDDATFIRRAFLDCIGSLPSPELVSEFVESADADKREKIIDRLLGLTGDSALDTFDDQYAAHWTLRWSDLIRNNSNSLGEQGMWALHNWIKESFRVNKPYDQFVSELVTAQGSIYSHGPANYYRINRNSSELTEATSQLFLGIRLECAKCHHHPFEKYGQGDYYGMAAFFSRVGTKNSEEFGLFGRETIVIVKGTGEVSHPRTRQRMEPTPLEGEPLDHELDRRLPLADWLTSQSNEFFAKAVVNRYMRYLLGVGLVEPVDDLRSTNPPSNAALMDALAADFVRHDYNLKHLIRTIMTSRLYGLSSTPTDQNKTDHKFYSHFQVKRIAAEPLLDALDHATGTQTKFQGLPIGTRAIELPDAEYPNYFLNTFAKPRRVSVCECERSPDASLAQALHTLNGETVAKKVADKNGLVANLLSASLEHDEIVTKIYLTALCRLPSAAELELSQDILANASSPEGGYQDLLWALINSKQFLFVY